MMKLFFICISIALLTHISSLNCGKISFNNRQLNDKTESAVYYIKDSLRTYTLKFNLISDSLIGNHCLTYSNGDKIDCCVDENSIFLKLDSQGNYFGVLKSCYDYTPHQISILLKNDTLIFKIYDNHVFLDKDESLFFWKSK
jgi:hypothetical protein